MINLLPKKQKDELAAGEMFKVTMVIGIVASAGLLCFSLMLFIVKLFFSVQLDLKTVAVEDREKMVEILKIGGEEEKIAAYNSTFSKLELYYKNQPGIVKIFERLDKALPAGLYLTSFELAADKVTLSGYCPDRDSLVVFKGNMEKEAGFKNVYFSTSNWIARKDINFNINFVYEPEG